MNMRWLILNKIVMFVITAHRVKTHRTDETFIRSINTFLFYFHFIAVIIVKILSPLYHQLSFIYVCICLYFPCFFFSWLVHLWYNVYLFCCFQFRLIPLFIKWDKFHFSLIFAFFFVSHSKYIYKLQLVSINPKINLSSFYLCDNISVCEYIGNRKITDLLPTY